MSITKEIQYILRRIPKSDLKQIVGQAMMDQMPCYYKAKYSQAGLGMYLLAVRDELSDLIFYRMANYNLLNDDESTEEEEINIINKGLEEMFTDIIKDYYRNQDCEDYGIDNSDFINESKYDKKHIKKILKEETEKQSKIINLIERHGIVKMSVALGGIRNLSRMLNEIPEVLLTRYISKEKFSTDDIEEVGGYDFKFKLLSVKKINDYYDFFFRIEEGTVTLIMTDDETEYDLLGDDIKNYEHWWEVEFEIQDILAEFAEKLLNRVKLYEDEDVKIRVNFTFSEKNKSN